MPEIIVVESGSDEPLRPLVDVPLPGDAREHLNDGTDLCGGATTGGDDMDAIEEAKARDPVED